MNLDLIFVVKQDGSYESVPLKKLRAQANFSDSFVVIANRGGIVKANIKLLSRTDRVISQFLLPSLEKAESLIGDKAFFQDYVNANVWRIAIDKKALQEISQSYSGQIEVSFTFTSLVDDERATNYIGDLTLDLPLSASNGDYLVCKLSSFTKNGITWNFGQLAIWDDGWKKGGTYRVEGGTTTHKMSVEPTLIGQLPDFDEEEANEVFNSLETMTSEISNVREDLDDLEEAMVIAEADILGLQNRMNTAESDIENIEDGTTVVDKALKDDLGNTIKSTYISDFNGVNRVINASDIVFTLKIKTPTGAEKTTTFSLPSATQVASGLLSATDKTRLDNLWAVLQKSDDPTFVDTINEILEIFSNYPEGLDIIAQFALKVETSNALTPDKIVLGDGDKIVKASNINATDLAFKNSDNAFLTPQTLPPAQNGGQATNLEQVSNLISAAIDTTPYEDRMTEYGVRFIQGQSSPVGERVKRYNGVMTVGANTGLIYNIGHDEVNAENSFDHLHAFAYERVLEADGNWYNRYPLRYTKYEVVTDGDTTYVYYWLCATKLTGYITPNVFLKKDGITPNDYILVGIYEAYRDANGKLRSIPNVFPTVSRSAANFLSDARANDGLGTDSEYTITDIAEYTYLLHRWLIRLGTRHVQSLMNGVVNMPYSADHKALLTEAGVNRIVLTNAQAATFVVGQTVGIGISTSDSSVAADRRITDIVADDPAEGQASLYFDGDPADITVDNVVATRVFLNGLTSGMAASDGYVVANNGKYPVRIEGIENPYGHMWKNIAGIKIYEDAVFVTDKLADYNWLANTDNYHKLNHLLPQANGYATEMGYDPAYPFARLTKTIGGSASTYYADYFYQNYAVGSYRTVFAGGGWYYGSFAGLWAWSGDTSLGAAYIHCGARLSKRPNS